MRPFVFCCLLACGGDNTTATEVPSSEGPSEPSVGQSTGQQAALDSQNESNEAQQTRQKIHGAPVMGQPSSHRVREPDPDHSRSDNLDIQQAMRLIEAQSYDEARSILNQVLQQFPDDSDAPYWMGQLYQAQGQHSDAVQWMQKAADMDPTFASAWWAVGFNYAIQRDCASALEAQNRYIELRPNDPSGYYNRASCRWYTKDRDGSLADGQKACDMGHQMACTHTKKQVKRQAMIQALEAERAKNTQPEPSNTTNIPNPTAPNP